MTIIADMEEKRSRAALRRAERDFYNAVHNATPVFTTATVGDYRVMRRFVRRQGRVAQYVGSVE